MTTAPYVPLYDGFRQSGPIQSTRPLVIAGQDFDRLFDVRRADLPRETPGGGEREHTHAEVTVRFYSDG